jgi:hypothetical protein
MMISWKTSWVGLSLLALACGGGGGFSDEHSNEILQDCSQTTTCMQPGAVQTMIESCVARQNKMLDSASENQQQTFLDDNARCNQLAGCMYVTCTQSDPNSGWAGMHQDLLTYECQQQSLCHMADGKMDPTTVVQDCISQLAAAINANPLSQQSYEQKGVNCAGKTGCAWTSCL